MWSNRTEEFGQTGLRNVVKQDGGMWSDWTEECSQTGLTSFLQVVEVDPLLLV